MEDEDYDNENDQINSDGPPHENVNRASHDPSWNTRSADLAKSKNYYTEKYKKC